MRNRSPVHQHVCCAGPPRSPLTAIAGAARAEDKRDFNIAPQPLADALQRIRHARAASPILVPPALTDSKSTGGVTADHGTGDRAAARCWPAPA